MNVTPQQFLSKLDANPREAAAFDACAPAGITRREHVEKVLACVEATIAENKALKARHAATKTKLAALEAAAAAIPAMKARLATEGARAANRKPAGGFVRNSTAKPKAPAPAPAETERDRLHREMQAIEDPAKRRAFRLRNWSKLSKQFSNPEPRK